MSRRTLTRIAAPTLFLAGFTIAVLLVRAGLADDERATTTAAVETTAAATTTVAATTRPRETTTSAEPVFATVEAGDTLDQIALENDTTVERLLLLNPNLDASSLQIGQRVRVR